MHSTKLAMPMLRLMFYTLSYDRLTEYVAKVKTTTDLCFSSSFFCVFACMRWKVNLFRQKERERDREKRSNTQTKASEKSFHVI